jgi:hypothetical protein
VRLRHERLVTGRRKLLLREELRNYAGLRAVKETETERPDTRPCSDVLIEWLSVWASPRSRIDARWSRISTRVSGQVLRASAVRVGWHSCLLRKYPSMTSVRESEYPSIHRRVFEYSSIHYPLSTIHYPLSTMRVSCSRCIRTIRAGVNGVAFVVCWLSKLEPTHVCVWDPELLAHQQRYALRSTLHNTPCN